MGKMNVKSSASFISNNSCHVKINQTGIAETAALIASSVREDMFHSTDWLSQDLHPKTKDTAAVEWCFFIDTINFSFWTPEERKFIVTYRDRQWTGYFAACACLNRAIDKGIPLTDAKYFATITEKELGEIFVDDNGQIMPLITERARVLNEAGRTLLQKFAGSFNNCLSLAEKSALKLLQIIVDNFLSYQDKATFEGKTVYFYKRAQILVADVWRCLDSQGPCAFQDIDEISMFADYRVPQIMAYLGVLDYSEELRGRLKRGEVFESGERMEVEIRGCSVHACELIVNEVKRISEESGQTLSIPVNSIIVDNFLWCYRRKIAEQVENFIPYHRIRTIYY